MIDHYRLKDLREAERLNEKEQKEESVEKNIEAQKKRRIITSSLMVLGIIMIVIAGFWYLQQSRKLSGKLAPDFSLTDLDGNTFWLSDFRGKVVVIDFMATSCLPCRASMPELKAVWEEYGGQIAMISISVSWWLDTEDELRDWMNEFEATWIHARDTADPPVTILYDASKIPKLVIIDKEGYIRFTHVAVTLASTIIQEVDQLLG